MGRSVRPRYPLMMLAMLAFLAASWAGLIRLGWSLPPLRPTLPLQHGPLMVTAFFGTLISLERAVALGGRWPYLGPLLSGLGGLSLASGVGGEVGPLLLTAGNFWLVVIFVVILRRHRADYTVTMALGAVSLFVGDLLWLAGWPVYRFVFWWAAFLVLTIAGERLELSRIVTRSAFSRRAFAAVALLFLAGLIWSLVAWDAGVRLTGLGTLGLALWLLHYDLARKTIRRRGLTRFIAACLLGGYFWLAISAGVMVVYGAAPAGLVYDAALHAVFIGFTFTMVFGHAPIIFPAVLGVAVRYRPAFYLPLALLHASLVLRLGGGLMGLGWARLWGGLVNLLAILLYLGMLAFSRTQGVENAVDRPRAA